MATAECLPSPRQRSSVVGIPFRPRRAAIKAARKMFLVREETVQPEANVAEIDSSITESAQVASIAGGFKRSKPCEGRRCSAARRTRSPPTRRTIRPAKSLPSPACAIVLSLVGGRGDDLRAERTASDVPHLVDFRPRTRYLQRRIRQDDETSRGCGGHRSLDARRPSTASARRGL